MDPMPRRVFQHQVLTYCRFAILAADDLSSASNITQAWYAIQNLLTATANIAKALWGSGGKFAQQREPLRQSIGVTDSSPLKDTVLRNHFEHYDERVDRWWAESPTHNYIDMNMGPVGPPHGNLVDQDIFRNYDPDTGILIFWGDRYDVPAIMTEIRRIAPFVEAEAAKPHWEP